MPAKARVKIHLGVVKIVEIGLAGGETSQGKERVVLSIPNRKEMEQSKFRKNTSPVSGRYRESFFLTCCNSCDAHKQVTHVELTPICRPIISASLIATYCRCTTSLMSLMGLNSFCM